MHTRSFVWLALRASLVSAQTSLTCDAVKGVFKQAGCCAGTGSAPVGTCDHLDLSKAVQVPANLNYDGMTVRTDVKAMVRGRSAVYQHQKEIYENYMSPTLYPESNGCNHMCYASGAGAFFDRADVKNVTARFPGLAVPQYQAFSHPEYSQYLMDYAYMPTSFSSTMNVSEDWKEYIRRGTMRQPVTCADEAILTSISFNDAMEELIPGWKTGDAYESVDSTLFSDCGQVMPAFGGIFETYTDGHISGDNVYGNTGHLLTRYNASTLAYDSEPLAVVIPGRVVRPDIPDPIYSRYLYAKGNNGGSRSQTAVHDDVVCMAGDSGQGWWADAPSSAAFQAIYGADLLARLGIDDTHQFHPTAFCYNKDFHDNDAPIAEYHLYNNIFWQKLGLTNDDDYAGFNNVSRHNLAIRDMEMTSDSIYWVLMGGRNQGFFVTRVSRTTGEWHITKHSSYSMRDDLGKEYLGNGQARTFHMTVDGEFVHVIQSQTGNTGKRLFKYRKHFEDLEGAVGIRELGGREGGGRWVATPGFYGTHPIAHFGNKVYFNNNGMFSATNDYNIQNATEQTDTGLIQPGLTEIAWPASRQWRIASELFFNTQTDDWRTQTINYGLSASDTHVFFQYGVARSFDPLPSDITQFNSENRATWMAEHANDVATLILKIDPATDTVVDFFYQKQAEGDGSEKFVVDKHGEYGYLMSCGTQRDSNFNSNRPKGVIRKVALTSGTKEVHSTTDVNGASIVNKVTFENGKVHQSTLSFDGLTMKDDANQVENVRIKRSELGMVHMNLEDRNVYVGQNIANMGIPATQHVADATQMDNVVIGTDLGNIENGMHRNILIGSHLYNGQKVERSTEGMTPAEIRVKQLASESVDLQTDADAKPMKNKFAVGMHGKTLLEGNLEHQIVNLPGAGDLKALKRKKMGDSTVDLTKALFTKNNIVQLIERGQVDGVQDILNQINSVAFRVCKLENPNNAAACSPDPPTNFMIDVITTMGPEEGFKLQSKAGAEWVDEVVLHNGIVTIRKPFDIMYEEKSFSGLWPPQVFSLPSFPNQTYSWPPNDFVVNDGGGIQVSGKIIPGTYKLIVSDTAGNGWQSDEGIGPFGSRNTGRATFTAGPTTETLHMGARYTKEMYDLPDDSFERAIQRAYLGHNLTAAQLSYQEVVFEVVGTYCSDTVKLTLTDSYGDGWNGNYINVNQGYSTEYTIESGNSASFQVCTDTLIGGCTVVELNNVEGTARAGPWGSWFSEVGLTVESDEFGIHTISSTGGNDAPSIRIHMCSSGVTVEEFTYEYRAAPAAD